MENSRDSKQTSFPIVGMSCAACAARIEKGLRKLEGVSDAHVNLASEKAVLIYKPALVQEEDFIRVVEDLGYQVPRPAEGKEKLLVSIGGMSCAACVGRVEKTLRAEIEISRR